MTHGAYSPTRIRQKARAHRRRILRNLGLAARDLDGMAREYLRLYAVGAAQLDLRHEGAEDATGNAKDYWVAYNATRRALERLEKRLGVLGLDKGRERAQGVETLIATGGELRESRNGD